MEKLQLGTHCWPFKNVEKLKITPKQQENKQLHHPHPVSIKKKTYAYQKQRDHPYKVTGRQRSNINDNIRKYHYNIYFTIPPYFFVTPPISSLCSIQKFQGKHAQRGVAQDSSHAHEEPSPQARRAAGRVRKTVIPQTQIEETNAEARKNEKAVDSNSGIQNEDNSESDADSAKEINSQKDASGSDDTSDSNAESTKHTKSSTRNKPAQSKQLPSTKNLSGRDNAVNKSKTKLFKAKPKPQDTEPKFEDLYYLADDSSKKRKSQQKKKKKNVRSANQNLQEVATVVTRMNRTLVVTRPEE
jgi:hypothetical protein